MKHAPYLFVAIALWASGPAAFAAEWNTQESRARWAELRQAMYGSGAAIPPAGGVLTLDAPDSAKDAALVPVTLKVAEGTRLKELDLVIDQNPSPVAAKVRFGAAGDPRRLKLRVRVNAFTNMHAVALLDDGRALQDVAYVQGAGGCSAPMGVGEAEASAGMGEMRMKFAEDVPFEGVRAATLMVRHPNFNGMQLNEKTHAFTPPRYIKSIIVTRGNATIFDLSTDISLSTNPVLEFLYRPDVENGQPIRVKVTDTTGKSWTEDFAPAQG